MPIAPSPSPPIEVIQDEWLELIEEYGSARAAALSLGVPVRTVQDRVLKARRRQRREQEASSAKPPREPRLEPLFPVGAFDRQRVERTRVEASLLADQHHVVQVEERGVPLECGHVGTIRKGSRFVCVVCHQSGKDAHPALQRNPATDPKPDEKPKPPSIKGARGKKLTRREKRRLAREAKSS